MSTHSRAVEEKKTYIIIITAAGLTRERGVKKKKGSAHSFCLFFKFAKKKKTTISPKRCRYGGEKNVCFPSLLWKRKHQQKIAGKKKENRNRKLPKHSKDEEEKTNYMYMYVYVYLSQHRDFTASEGCGHLVSQKVQTC